MNCVGDEAALRRRGRRERRERREKGSVDRCWTAAAQPALSLLDSLASSSQEIGLALAYPRSSALSSSEECIATAFLTVEDSLGRFASASVWS
ncbi:hypothetical protein J437_LFUL008300 [Ladona fulva]|uniref:Uncharacterized protein n=1 Tax=Ladona fulva TaxID=123851 RepID=A0A8K0P2G4_LADFU|nr:hypothetical protein J437_LFUL008300 [Ladona fulva]